MVNPRHRADYPQDNMLPVRGGLRQAHCRDGHVIHGSMLYVSKQQRPGHGAALLAYTSPAHPVRYVKSMFIHERGSGTCCHGTYDETAYC